MSILEIIWVLITLFFVFIGFAMIDVDGDVAFSLFFISFWSIVFMFIHFDFLTTKLW